MDSNYLVNYDFTYMLADYLYFIDIWKLSNVSKLMNALLETKAIYRDIKVLLKQPIFIQNSKYVFKKLLERCCAYQFLQLLKNINKHRLISCTPKCLTILAKNGNVPIINLLKNIERVDLKQIHLRKAFIRDRVAFVQWLLKHRYLKRPVFDAAMISKAICRDSMQIVVWAIDNHIYERNFLVCYYASKFNRVDILELTKEHELNDNDFCTCQAVAERYGNLEVMDWFWKNGYDFSICNIGYFGCYPALPRVVEWYNSHHLL